MPLIDESYDSLPYIDTAITDAHLTAAKSLIESEIKSAGVDATQLHPALIPSSSFTPKYPDALENEYAELEADPKHKIRGIDLSRYEALEAPASADLEQWIASLKKAYTSSEFLDTRVINLNLLEKFGKNAWLIGNWQTEHILRDIEAELAEKRQEAEAVEGQRRQQQENVSGEFATLEETWKRGVGRVLETEVAVEGLRREIREKRRAGAV